ncbi:ABC transporter permease [Salinispira pacifica]|uniref:Glycine betaine/carnitine/choline ABC transporter, permease protein n=1 Tax=Salinispira pacifica TaxID=1307761 RepID=V5WIB5_9SPIO|nr:ABC transporter permease [Salinispira pacifica]AHC15513.1 Glycine betaine/carnitine/choline ABC transporter, permease protein [Salinispira pacifica]
MNVRDRQQHKYSILAVIIFTVSFIFPFADIRENRVAGSVPLWAGDLLSRTGPGGVLLLMLPPVLLILAILLRRSGRFSREALWLRIIPALLPGLSILTAFWVLSGIPGAYEEFLGEFGRVGMGFGFYLFILAGIVPLLSDRPPKGGAWIALGVFLITSVLLYTSSALDSLGIIREASNQQRRLLKEIGNHISITLSSVGIAVVIGVPGAFISYQYRRIRNAVFPVLNVLQTIPSIALFGLMIAPLAALSRAMPLLRQMGLRGIGNTPAIIALSMYALYPVLRYSYTALSEVDGKVIDAARGMGMNTIQLWGMVRLPLGIPVILHGIRVALIQTLGNATLAKLVGGGGLGVFVFEGLGQASSDMVLLGMFLIIAITLVADQLLTVLIRLLTPKALQNQYSAQTGESQ